VWVLFLFSFFPLWVVMPYVLNLTVNVTDIDRNP
jgi:hypothetical protein